MYTDVKTTGSIFSYNIMGVRAADAMVNIVNTNATINTLKQIELSGKNRVEDQTINIQVHRIPPVLYVYITYASLDQIQHRTPSSSFGGGGEPKPALHVVGESRV